MDKWRSCRVALEKPSEPCGCYYRGPGKAQAAVLQLACRM